jgi:hypothetical protein
VSKTNDEVGADKYPSSPTGVRTYRRAVAISAREACVSKTNDEVGADKYPSSPTGVRTYRRVGAISAREACVSKINDQVGADTNVLTANRLTIRPHFSAKFLRTAAGPSLARYARDVLSRDVPRETGCSRLAILVF